MLLNSINKLDKTEVDLIFILTKRIVDVSVSLLILILIFPPIFLLVAIAIKIDSKGPIFFVQRRSGINNSVFNCYKFRSMKVNRYAHLIQAKKGDDRKTKVGNFLRKTNIDELPQFWNVLRGDMSIVGPRPHMIKHTIDYSNQIDNYMQRLNVKPGITGLAQVRGYRGETTMIHQMSGRVRLDLWYIQHQNPLLDVWIFFKTIKNATKGDKCAH